MTLRMKNIEGNPTVKESHDAKAKALLLFKVLSGTQMSSKSEAMSDREVTPRQ